MTGTEFAQHARLSNRRADLFCDPHSPWQSFLEKFPSAALRRFLPRKPTSRPQPASTSTTVSTPTTTRRENALASKLQPNISRATVHCKCEFPPPRFARDDTSDLSFSDRRCWTCELTPRSRSAPTTPGDVLVVHRARPTPAGQVGRPPAAMRRASSVVGDVDVERAGAGIDDDGVAVAHRRDRAAARRFGRDVADQDAVATRRRSDRR